MKIKLILLFSAFIALPLAWAQSSGWVDRVKVNKVSEMTVVSIDNAYAKADELEIYALFRAALAAKSLNRQLLSFTLDVQNRKVDFTLTNGASHSISFVNLKANRWVLE